MKNLLLVLLALAAITFQSCNKDDGDDFSDNSALTEIFVNDNAIVEFQSDITFYTVELPTGSDAPVIRVTAEHPAATTEFNQPSSADERVRIKCIAEDQTSTTYTIELTTTEYIPSDNAELTSVIINGLEVLDSTSVNISTNDWGTPVQVSYVAEDERSDVQTQLYTDSTVLIVTSESKKVVNRYIWTHVRVATYTTIIDEDFSDADFTTDMVRNNFKIGAYAFDSNEIGSFMYFTDCIKQKENPEIVFDLDLNDFDSVYLEVKVKHGDYAIETLPHGRYTTFSKNNNKLNLTKLLAEGKIGPLDEGSWQISWPCYDSIYYFRVIGVNY